MQPLVERLLDAVRQRYDGDLETDWIVPRAQRGGTALAIVVRAANADGRQGGLLDATSWNAEIVATCAVAGSDADAFGRLDQLQHAVTTLATDPPALSSPLRLVGLDLASTEWGETEQGDVRVCEVRLRAMVIEQPL